MRKFLILFLGVVSLVLLVAMLWPVETDLSDADVQAITAQVPEKTLEPILSVQPMGHWKVQVDTGTSNGPLSGGGHYFYLHRSWRGWRIYESGMWVS